MWRHIGVDWDSGSWVAVGITDNEEFEVNVYETIASLWSKRGASAERIVLDIPIGLCGTSDEPGGAESAGDELYRECDALARNIIGSRRSSVFKPPCREVVEEAVDTSDGYTLTDDIYSKMNEKNKHLTGKGLMQHGRHIAPGILEVDDLIRERNLTRISSKGIPSFASEPSRKMNSTTANEPHLASPNVWSCSDRWTNMRRASGRN